MRSFHLVQAIRARIGAFTGAYSRPYSGPDQQDGPATSMGAEAASAGVDVTTTSHPRCDVGGSTKLLSEITVFQPAGALKLPLASVLGGVSQRS